MIHAGIREVKNNLSRLLVKVKAGQEIVITERGKAIARIVKEVPPTDDVRASLSPLIERRLRVSSRRFRPPTMCEQAYHR